MMNSIDPGAKLSEINCTPSGARCVELDGTRWFLSKDVLLALGVIRPLNDRRQDYLHFLSAAADHERTVMVGRTRTSVVSEVGVKLLIERWAKKSDPIRKEWFASKLNETVKMAELVSEAVPSVALQAQYRSARERLTTQAEDLRKRLEKIEEDLAALDRAAEIMAMERL